MLPPRAGAWGLDRFLMHDLRWEHLVAAALTPMGPEGLLSFQPVAQVTSLQGMIAELLGQGFSMCNIAGGGE